MQSKHFANHSISPCSCDWVQARLFDYLDGTLNAGERERLQAHNAACPACERKLQAASRSEMALHRAVGMAPAAGDLRPGFYAKLAASETQSRPSRRFGWAVAVPAFAACLVALVLWRPASAPKSSGELLLVEKPTAFVQPKAKSYAAKSDASDSLMNKQIRPVIATRLPSPVLGSPSPERLSLAQTSPVTVRLTPQEIRQVRRSGLVRAEVSNGRLLSRAQEARMFGFAYYRSEHFNEAEKPTLQEQISVSAAMPTLSARSFHGESLTQPKDAPPAMFDRAGLGTGGTELRQNVNKVALTYSTEPDSESYLEVKDDTRNFSYSARLASTQDSDGGEIELSISSDESDANPEGAGTE